jgi:hypothetical protein
MIGYGTYVTYVKEQRLFTSTQPTKISLVDLVRLKPSDERAGHTSSHSNRRSTSTASLCNLQLSMHLSVDDMNAVEINAEQVECMITKSDVRTSRKTLTTSCKTQRVETSRPRD